MRAAVIQVASDKEPNLIRPSIPVSSFSLRMSRNGIHDRIFHQRSGLESCLLLRLLFWARVQKLKLGQWEYALYLACSVKPAHFVPVWMFAFLVEKLVMKKSSAQFFMFVPSAVETAWVAFGDGSHHDFDGPRPRGSILSFWAWARFRLALQRCYPYFRYLLSTVWLLASSSCWRSFWNLSFNGLHDWFDPTLTHSRQLGSRAKMSRITKALFQNVPLSLLKSCAARACRMLIETL